MLSRYILKLKLGKLTIFLVPKSCDFAPQFHKWLIREWDWSSFEIKYINIKWWILTQVYQVDVVQLFLEEKTSRYTLFQTNVDTLPMHFWKKAVRMSCRSSKKSSPNRVPLVVHDDKFVCTSTMATSVPFSCKSSIWKSITK